MRTPAPGVPPQRAPFQSGLPAAGRTLLAVCLALLWATSAIAAIPGRHDEPLAFVPVLVAGPSVDRVSGPDRVSNRDRPSIRGPVRTVRDVVPPRRPTVRLPANPPRVVRIVSDVSGAGSDDAHVSGVASWYCGNGSACTRGYPDGLYAAAGPALRVGDWRGRTVTVTAGSSSVRVRLIDW